MALGILHLTGLIGKNALLLTFNLLLSSIIHLFSQCQNKANKLKCASEATSVVPFKNRSGQYIILTKCKKKTEFDVTKSNDVIAANFAEFRCALPVWICLDLS